MKIVCDACGAKYSIADEKVRGKVFKIRCKRCSNIIVVRGDQESAAEPAADPALDNKETRVFDYSGYDNPAEAAAAEASAGAIWHIVVDQEQVGPMTASEVGQRFKAGEIDAESYIWQEGFADWERLADVAEFASLAAGGGGAADDANMFGGPHVDESQTAQNDPADLFAAAAGAGAADPGADLFGGAAAAGGAAEPDGLFGGAPAAAAGVGAAAAAEPESRLKGERNENSVLFSLSNLASLASGDSSSSSSSSSPVASSPSPTASKTTATQEGSGLIDIRSMAQVYLGDEGGGKAAPSTGSVDDLPSFSASSFGAPASPMLLPTAPAESDNKKLLFALVGVIGVLALAAIVLVVMVLKGGDEEKVASNDTTAATTGTSGTGGSDGDKTGATTPPTGDNAGGEDDKPTDTKAGGEDDKPASTKPTDTKPRDTKPRDTKPRDTKPRDTKPRDTKPKDPPKSDPPTSSGGCDEVTCLVEPNKACCKKYRSSGSKGGSNSNLPERPSKAAVKQGISGVMGRVRSCGSKHGGGGLVKVRVKVGSSGRVSSASPSPANALGKCVASAVRKAKFPKTQRGVTFTYPFRF